MRIQYIEAPNSPLVLHSNSLFLGGGITGCEDWQKRVIDEVLDLEMTVVNPRRANFDTSNPKETEIQIDWEYDYLRRCNQVMFWFSPETLCPITLFELGATLERFALEIKEYRQQELFIGCDPNYKRILDVIHQSRKKGIGVFTDLDKLIDAIKQFNQ